MAEAGADSNPENSPCSICLDPPIDPVSLPCKHSYCMSCIHTHWDGEDEEEKKIYSCPQCRQTFTDRPVQRNITFADLKEALTEIEPQTVSDDPIYIEVIDVTCDMCSGTKKRAVKSCQQCLVSYCASHLQPHYDVPQFKRHELIEPTRRLQENICPHHGELMRMFCRTDQQCICYHCPVDDHKGHDTVSAVAERDERQRELEVGRRRIKAWIQEKEKDLKVLQQEMEKTGRFAEATDEYSEKIFTVLMRLMEKRRCDMKEQIRSRRETQVNRNKNLQQRLVKEIAELMREDAELHKLSLIEDHNQFLQSCTSRPKVRKPSHTSSLSLLPVCYFEDMTAVVSELRDHLLFTLNDDWTNTFKQSCEITLDTNTVHKYLSVCEGGKRVTQMTQKQKYVAHSHRFSVWQQVLSRDSLTGRCYWEVEWSGTGADVAVAYQTIKRDGAESQFGNNKKSWALNCNINSYVFQHSGVTSPVSGPTSSRIGVYLDHRAGVLSFYSVCETMTLLHRVQTTFTQPLYAGVRLYFGGDTAKFTKLTLMSAA